MFEVDNSSRIVLVEGEGPTVDKAREAAIKTAIDKVYGSLVLSDQAVSNGKVVRNDVSMHRSAYVSETEIVETTQPGPKKYRVKLWAKVTGSHLYSRSIPVPAGSQALDGAVVAQQLKAVLAFKEEGDRVLNKAMEAYPLNAFQVSVENGTVNLDEQRNSQIRIRIRVEWRPLYVDAMREAANLLAVDKSHCNLLTAAFLSQGGDYDRHVPIDRTGKAMPVTGMCGEFADLIVVRSESGKMLPQVYGYTFADAPRMSLLSKKLSAPIRLQLSLESENGRDADTFCESVAHHPLINLHNVVYGRYDRQGQQSFFRPQIRQDESWLVEWPLNITNLDKFRKIKRITAKVVAAC